MQTMRSFIALLKGARRIEWIALAAALAIVCLLALGAFTPAPENTQTELETRVAEALSHVSGAGSVRVLI